MRLANKVALVTGATGGFGEEIARLFAAEGASLVLHGRRQEVGEAMAEAFRAADTPAVFCGGDVGEESTASKLAAAADEAYGRIDVLVLNAGVALPGNGPFWEVPVADFDVVQRTNVRGPLLGARACVPLMSSGSSVILIGSTSSVFARPNLVAYATSKGAVLQMGRAMAADLVSRGIRVNVVCPGSCDTPMERGFIDQADDPTAMRVALSSAPMGRMGTAAEVAQATLFFACDDSSYCTGAHLMVDGGRTAMG